MAREWRSPVRRGTGSIADPFESLRSADKQRLQELHQLWARMPCGTSTPAAAAAARSTTLLEITFSANNGVPVFSDGTSPEDVWVDDDAYRDGGFGAVLASGAAVAGLPVAAPGETTREEECAVCLESFGDGNKAIIRKMRCPDAHAFHESCIFEWLSVSRVCPLCRFPLPPTDEETDDESDAEGS